MLGDAVGTSRPTTLHRVQAVSVCATVVVLELPASFAPSFLRLVRPAMPWFRLELFCVCRRAAMLGG